MDRKQAKFERDLERLQTLASLWDYRREQSLVYLQDIIAELESVAERVEEFLPDNTPENEVLCMNLRFGEVKEVVNAVHDAFVNDNVPWSEGDEEAVRDSINRVYNAYFSRVNMPCCECGGVEFSAHQVCRMDIVVNGYGDFERALNGDEGGASIYDAENPYGPFTCLSCGKEYYELPEIDD